MKQEFIEFLNQLMEANKELTNELMTNNIRTYIEALTETKAEKPEITDNGKLILQYLQDTPIAPYKSKEIADALFVSSRKVSGGMRKLVTDGFVEKVGESPVSYILTEKGKNYTIED